MKRKEQDIPSTTIINNYGFKKTFVSSVRLKNYVSASNYTWSIIVGDILYIPAGTIMGNHKPFKYNVVVRAPGLYPTIFSEHIGLPHTHTTKKRLGKLQYKALLPCIKRDSCPFVLSKNTSTIHVSLKQDQYIGQDAFIGLLDPSVSTICIRAPMGSGKTTATATAFASVPKGKSILVISPRITITYTVQSKFADAGVVLNNYIDLKESGELDDPSKRHRLVVSPNALYLLHSYDYDYVVIDEIMLLLTYINGTHPRNKKIILAVFEKILLSAKTLLLTDAYLHGTVVDTIAEYRGTTTYLSYDKEQAVEYKYSDYNKFIELLPTLKRAYVFCETKKMADDIYEQSPVINKLLVSATTDKRLLRDPNKLFVKYDIIVTTPVILSGFDFNVHHFDDVYGVFNGNIIGTMGILQMSGRIRLAKTCTFIRKSNAVYDNSYLDDEYFITHADTYKALTVSMTDNGVVLDKSLKSDLCMCIVRFNRKMNIYSKSFKQCHSMI